MNPLIITAALTGSLSGRDKNPRIPITTEDIVQAGAAAANAGASVLHIHVREADGSPSLREELFEAVMTGLRQLGCEAICNLTTGGGGVFRGRERYEHLRLQPEMGSLDCGSMNFGEWVFENSPAFLRELAREFIEQCVKPELETFDISHILNALRLREEGLLRDPLHFQFVLGVRGGAPATTEQVLHMRRLIPADATWSVCALGRHQLSMNGLAIIEGGHTRTGLEDNLYYRRGELATSNEQLVARVVRIAREFGRPVASPDQARAALSLPVPVVS